MMDYNANLPLEQIQAKFKEIAKTLPTLAGSVIVNFALDNFRRQGFMGASFQPWRPRKTNGKWGKKARNSNRAILVQTARLKRSIRTKTANWNEIVVGSDVPYAKAHNDGVRLGVIQTVKSHSRNITKLKTVQGGALKTVSKVGFQRAITGTTTVAEHKRRINQNIPARPYLKDSPYLSRDLQRTIAAAIMKSFK